MRGECQCLNAAKGNGCFVPIKWECNASNYASGDGCDCGCGVWDPDCNGLWPNNNDCPASERIRLERADVLDWDDRCFHCPVSLPRHFGSTSHRFVSRVALRARQLPSSLTMIGLLCVAADSFTQPGFEDRVETRVSFPGTYNPFPDFPFDVSANLPL